MAQLFTYHEYFFHNFTFQTYQFQSNIEPPLHRNLWKYSTQTSHTPDLLNPKLPAEPQIKL